MIKVVTWNINSVRLRLPLVLEFLREHQPDILALQETKTQDENFPLQAFLDEGYKHTIFAGQKSYNGVALISRIPLTSPDQQRIVNDDKRHISAILPGGMEFHNFYVPAGGDIPDPIENPKFDHKLRFVDEMTSWVKAHRKAKDKMIIVGDFNIAPYEHDVWSHKQLLDVVSHTPIEVEKLTKLRETLDWVDVMRHFVPQSEKLYSWWSYRNQDWKKSDRGRRLDHVWVTPALQPALKSGSILREARDYQTPSDHVPVIVEIAL